MYERRNTTSLILFNDLYTSQESEYISQVHQFPVSHRKGSIVFLLVAILFTSLSDPTQARSHNKIHGWENLGVLV